MTLEEQIEHLRGRFSRLRGARPFLSLAPLVGCDARNLVAFTRGNRVTAVTLLLIERWCDQEDPRQPLAQVARKRAVCAS